MRLIKIIKGEYYHIYLRGNNKQIIFHDDRDRARFLFLILYLQSPDFSFNNAGRYITQYVEHSVFNIKGDVVKEIVKTRVVELVAFTLMPNHFHLIARNTKAGGTTRYMQKVLNAYTKYYNEKYGASGHLFSGPYQYRHIKDENTLAYMSAYVHRNVSELNKWYGKETSYVWSSFQDFVGKNRWGDLLCPEIITDRFTSGKEYKTFVSQSGAKAYLDMDDDLLIDTE